MNNLFSHSPKELTTDGFLAWLICEIANDNRQVLILFQCLGLCSESVLNVSNVKVSRQEKNTDLIVRFDADSIPNAVLFETKTHTTIHSNQLSKYKHKFPDFQGYKYLKLARVSYEENKQAALHGYDVIDSRCLLSALGKLSVGGDIVTQYKQYLLEYYVKPIGEIEGAMVLENKYYLFSDRQAQQYLIDKVYEAIDGTSDSIYFKSYSNVDGSPWTQLDISRKNKTYGESSEFLFWRIDKKSGKYYLRLNQYAGISKDYKTQKKRNLYKLRSEITPLFDRFGLSTSKPSNRGVKESEVCIMFFHENSLQSIVDVLIPLTNSIIEVYSGIEYS